MALSYIISEFHITGSKQIVLEKVTGDEPCYKVTTIKRCKSLGAAKDVFLKEVSSQKRNYYAGEISNFALKHGIKLQPEKTETAKPAPKRGRKPNAKSNSKTT